MKDFFEFGRMITYRLLTPEDAVGYRALRLHSYQEAPLAFSESYEDERHRPLADFAEELQQHGRPPEWFVLGAILDDRLTGFVKFRRDRRSKARHKSMLHAMYVHPDLRGEGVGKALVERTLERARQLDGLEQIHLWVLHAEGKSAAAFYRRLGFRSQGPLVHQDLKAGETYIDAEYMTIHL